MQVEPVYENSRIWRVEECDLKGISGSAHVQPEKEVPFSREFLEMRQGRKAVLFPLPALSLLETRDKFPKLFAKDDNKWKTVFPSTLVKPLSRWVLVDRKLREATANKPYSVQAGELRGNGRYAATAHEVIWSLLIYRFVKKQWPKELDDAVIRTSTEEKLVGAEVEIEGGCTLCVTLTDGKIRLFIWPKKYHTGAVFAAHNSR